VAAVAGPDCGAVSLFLGTVRDSTGPRRVIALQYEAYDEMAGRVLEAIAAEVAARHDPCRISIVHRTGKLLPGEIAVIVAVASPHRASAFDACREAMELVKTRAPIWKKEFFEDGAEWVGA
jgi:molybdopterin synthase catalytic subunit